LTPFPLRAGEVIDRAALVSHWAERLAAPSGSSKQTSLQEAMATVRPADAVYLGGSLARPNAAAFELVRQLRGTNPALTIIAPAFANQHAVMVRCGLVAKVITSLHGNTYPGPGPNPVFTEADRSGAVEFEDWSMLSLVQRLYAAASNVPFAPTTSLSGSDLGRTLEARGLLRFVPDPFGAGETAVVPPLHPDVVVVHALMADAAGNAVMAPPYYEDAWAAFAARRAVVVTAERIVDTQDIRRYAQFVRVPGSAVTAVCEVPFGAHPNQVPGGLVPEVGGYGDDYDFLDQLRLVCKDPEQLDEWIRTWVLDVRSHEGYLDRLGAQRLAQLRGTTAPGAWQRDLPMLEERWHEPATAGEMASVLGARVLERLAVRDGHRLLLAGVGISTIAAWLATAGLKRAGVDADLLAEGGMYGYTPLPTDPYLFNYRNLYTCTSMSNVQTILDVIGGGFGNKAVGVLGAAQVDASGAINTSRVGGRMLTGSGGGNDIASAAAAVVVTTTHDRNRLPESVEFVTSPGHRVTAIVTDRAVLERGGAGEPFVLTEVLARAGRPLDDLVRAAVDGCGWELAVAPGVRLSAELSDCELAAVRTYDPRGNFVG
jgi:acyl CoA:acetate/3-ketoacid CoA transferase alpha subunit/acyl CoA:acetate/3-ketoacid CoA transferase beta subunit